MRICAKDRTTGFTGRSRKNNIIETVQMASEFWTAGKGGVFMSAFFASFVSTAVKAVILAAVALAGIVLGKKFRDKKSTQQ